MIPHIIGGPLCFQGDVLAKGFVVEKLAADDIMVLRDAGSNCLSIFSRHCSLPMPAVLGYRRSATEQDRIIVLKEAESFEALCAFWGA